MGEIKSTLDLVMERTRHLTLSKEEQEAQRHEELRKSLNGLIQKYLDHLLRVDQFLKKFEELECYHRQPKEHMLCEEILARIDLGGHSEPLLKLLELGCSIDTTPLKAILEAFVQRRTVVGAARVQEWKDAFQQETGISGSAVIPNLEADEDYAHLLGELMETYAKRLKMEKAKLLP